MESKIFLTEMLTFNTRKLNDPQSILGKGFRSDCRSECIERHFIRELYQI